MRRSPRRARPFVTSHYTLLHHYLYDSSRIFGALLRMRLGPLQIEGKKIRVTFFVH